MNQNLTKVCSYKIKLRNKNVGWFTSGTVYADSKYEALKKADTYFGYEYTIEDIRLATTPDDFNLNSLASEVETLEAKNGTVESSIFGDIYHDNSELLNINKIRWYSAMRYQYGAY